MTQSRAKGKRGELAAAAAIGEVLGVPFRRTQQYNGLGRADIEPVGGCDYLHFEVKSWGSRLTWWVKRAAEDPLHVANGLCYCELKALPKVLRGGIVARSSVSCGLAERAMEQAVRDAKGGALPVVLIRQDGSPWLIVWRETDDDAFGLRIMRLADEVPPNPAAIGLVPKDA